MLGFIIANVLPETKKYSYCSNEIKFAADRVNFVYLERERAKCGFSLK